MRLLDLFCGAGGCSVGYQRAGFTDIVGVDTDAKALRRYPFHGVRMDAMTALAGGIDLDAFDAIHASPPCQAYSAGTRASRAKGSTKQHPDLLQPVLDHLSAWGDRTGRPWVVENVPGAPMPADHIVICGAQHRAYDDRLGRMVRLRRHRLFTSNVPLMAEPCSCDWTQVTGVYGGASTSYEHAKYVRRGAYRSSTKVNAQAMCIDWMTDQQLCQAIPPAYTEHIGWQLIDHIKAVATAERAS